MAAEADAADDVTIEQGGSASAQSPAGRAALVWRCNPRDEVEHPLAMLPRAAFAFPFAYAPAEKLFSEGHTLPRYPYQSLAEVDTGVVLAETPALAETLKDLEAGVGGTRFVAMPGPMALLSSLVDPTTVYRASRDPLLDETLFALADALAAYGRAAIGAGAGVLSLADAVGCCELAGKRFFTTHSGPALVRFLRGVGPALDHALVHLCGKTSISLVGTGMARAEQVRAKQPARYPELLLSQADDPSVRIVGHGCVHVQGDSWQRLTLIKVAGDQ